MKIEAFAKEQHFRDHLEPIVKKLEEAGVDVYWTGRGERPQGDGLFALVASSGDLVRANEAKRLVFFAEHGAGQSYSSSRHSSYAGGVGRDNVCCFISPGPHVDAMNAKYYPKIPSIPAGVPKLDEFHLNISREPEDMNYRTDEHGNLVPRGLPVVCFSFHWDCHVCPETRSGFEEFKHSILLARNTGEFEVIVHCHPRAVQMCLPFYEQHNLEYVENFEDVLKRADVYVCDNSSTIFEFASVGKPVVLLNPSFYRKRIKHGLRFWTHANIGEQADDQHEALRAIRLAALDTREKKAARAAKVKEIYHGVDGKAAERAAEGIIEFMQEFLRMKEEGCELRVKRFSMGEFGFVDPNQTILLFEGHAIVQDTLGRFVRKLVFPDTLAPKTRVKRVLEKSPRNYELVDRELQVVEEDIDPLDIDYSTNISLADEFTPVDKSLTAEELYIMQAIAEDKSKTAIVYKSGTKFKVATLQRAWDRLETEGFIVQDKDTKKWTSRTWGQ